jgi:DNA-binding MarR family transcriptional regulator
MAFAEFYPRLERCYRLARYILQEVLTEWGIWAGQDRILRAIQPDQIIIQSELARRLCMEERTLHRSLKYLAKHSFIQRRESISDMRVSAITLTRMGVKAVDAIDYTYCEVAKLMCVGLNESERRELYRLLELATRREYELRARQSDLRDFLDGGRFS